MASSAASDNVSTEVLQRTTMSAAAMKGRTSLEASDDQRVCHTECARTGLNNRTHVAIADEQRTGRDALLAQCGHCLHQLKMVFFRSEYRAHPNHELILGETEFGALAPSLTLAERLPVREIDAVVDYFRASCSQQTTPPVTLLCLADENQAIRAPEQGAIVEHLQPFLCARQQRAVKRHDNPGMHARLATGEPAIHQRIWICRHHHGWVNTSNMRSEVRYGAAIEIAPRVQATNPARAAQANAVQLLGRILYVDGMAFMAAFGEAVHESYGVALRSAKRE